MPESKVATTYVEWLTMARDKITPDNQWIQGRDALIDPSDNQSFVDPDDERATCWCAYGAIASIKTGLYHWAALDIVARSINPTKRTDMVEAIADFNDSHGHAQVLEMFDEAIVLAKHYDER